METMEARINDVIDKCIDPVLSEHYGNAMLSKLEDDVAYIKLGGACASCPASQNTIEEVVKTALIENVPGLVDVRLDTSVSEELLDAARAILNGTASVKN